MEIYAISGKMGSGKDYIMKKLFLPLLQEKEPKPTLFLAFADHIKVDACAKGGVSYDRVYGEKDEESRQILQKMGTEEGRNKYGENVWINAVWTWMQVHHQQSGIERFILTDVRFLNELNFVKEKGGKVFRVHSPHRTNKRLEAEANGDPTVLQKIKTHPSETDLDKYDDFDFVIFNDEGDDAQGQVEKIVNSFI